MEGSKPNRNKKDDSLGIGLVKPKFSDIGSRLARKFSNKYSSSHASNPDLEHHRQPEDEDDDDPKKKVRFRVDSTNEDSDDTTPDAAEEFISADNVIFNKLSFENYQLDGLLGECLEVIEPEIKEDIFHSETFDKEVELLAGSPSQIIEQTEKQEKGLTYISSLDNSHPVLAPNLPVLAHPDLPFYSVRNVCQPCRNS